MDERIDDSRRNVARVLSVAETTDQAECVIKALGAADVHVRFDVSSFGGVLRNEAIIRHKEHGVLCIKAERAMTAIG